MNSLAEADAKYKDIRERMAGLGER